MNLKHPKHSPSPAKNCSGAKQSRSLKGNISLGSTEEAESQQVTSGLCTGCHSDLPLHLLQPKNLFSGWCGPVQIPHGPWAGWAGLRAELCALCALLWRRLGRAQIPLMRVLAGNPAQVRCGQSQPLV